MSEELSKYKSPKSKAEPSGSKVGAVALAPKYVFAKLFTEAMFVATVLIEATVPEAPKAVISVSNPMNSSYLSFGRRVKSSHQN